MKSDRVPIILLLIAVLLLACDIVVPRVVRAGGTRVTVTKVKPGVQLDLPGYQVLGFSCVLPDDCMILSR